MLVVFPAQVADPSPDNGKHLILNDGEEIYESIPGVMNLSKDHGQLGTLWVTSHRVAWAAQLQDNYNCSVPFLQACLLTQSSCGAPVAGVQCQEQVILVLI